MKPLLLVVVALIGTATALLPPVSVDTRHETPVFAAKTPTEVSGALSTLVVQAMGRRCITPRGWCPLRRPQPINSECQCPDGSRGTVVP
jgi:hypothetical protein